MTLGIHKTLDLGFEEARARITDVLAGEGFGILTEIDVRATLQKKLGTDVGPYAILGACNPPFAHQALQADPDAGLMMPCNVVLRAGAEGQTHVTAVDPSKAAAATGNPRLVELAADVKAKLERALEKLG